MEIRNFRLEDYDEVYALWKHAGLKVNALDTKEAILKKLMRDPELFVVVIHDDKIIGAGIGAYDGRRGWIYRLAVAEEYRGNGAGRLIIDTISERLKWRGCRRIGLTVNRHAQAVTFYTRLGFKAQNSFFMSRKIK